MGRHTETVAHTYGEDSELSFGDLLLKCLRISTAEIAADIAASEAAGISHEPATPRTTAASAAAKAKNDIRLRLVAEALGDDEAASPVRRSAR